MEGAVLLEVTWGQTEQQKLAKYPVQSVSLPRTISTWNVVEQIAIVFLEAVLTPERGNFSTRPPTVQLVASMLFLDHRTGIVNLSIEQQPEFHVANHGECSSHAQRSQGIQFRTS